MKKIIMVMALLIGASACADESDTSAVNNEKPDGSISYTAGRYYVTEFKPHGSMNGVCLIIQGGQSSTPAVSCFYN